MRDLPKGTISFCWRVPNCLFRLGFLKAYSTGLIFAALACSMVSYELNAPFFVQISSLLNCTICLREIIATTKKFIDARSELSSFIFQIAELNLFISRVLSACIIIKRVSIKYVHSRFLFAFQIMKQVSIFYKGTLWRFFVSVPWQIMKGLLGRHPSISLISCISFITSNHLM